MENEKRLIDAEAIERKIKKANCVECNVVRKVQCSACWVNDVLELLDGDVVDAVEVVRCKDCKCAKPPRNTKYVGTYVWCALYDPAPMMRCDDFCSYGERREGE